MRLVAEESCVPLMDRALRVPRIFSETVTNANRLDKSISIRFESQIQYQLTSYHHLLSLSSPLFPSNRSPQEIQLGVSRLERQQPVSGTDGGNFTILRKCHSIAASL